MINHVYDPLVDAARTNSPHGQKLLEQLGEKLLNANPGCCHSVEDGMRLARTNLSLYANFFPPTGGGSGACLLRTCRISLKRPSGKAFAHISFSRIGWGR